MPRPGNHATVGRIAAGTCLASGTVLLLLSALILGGDRQGCLGPLWRTLVLLAMCAANVPTLVVTLVLTLLYRPRDLRWLLPALVVIAASVAVLLYYAPAGNCNLAS